MLYYYHTDIYNILFSHNIHIYIKDGAIVHDEPGITRDRTYRTATWCDYNFQVVDTGR